jgi:Phytanoyl-CoA dioxygenase (PhyH)
MLPEIPPCEDLRVHQLFPSADVNGWRKLSGECGVSIATCNLMAQSFYKNGYIVLKDWGILDNVDLERMDTHIQSIYNHEQGRIQDAWLSSPDVRNIATNKKVMELLKYMYGRKSVPFQTLNFLKGTQQRTHSDTIHFSSLPERFMCGVWVALEDIDLHQGPLQYFPGSNRLPIRSYVDLGIEPLLDIPPSWQDPRTPAAYKEYEDKIAIIAGTDPELLKIKKGDALIWAANLLHGGSKILCEHESRKSQVTHYYFEDTIPLTPMFSDMGKGVYYLRYPLDIDTMKPMKISYNGSPYTTEAAGHGRFRVHKTLQA